MKEGKEWRVRLKKVEVMKYWYEEWVTLYANRSIADTTVFGKFAFCSQNTFAKLDC